ncbi:hypothetical protein J3L18_08260 [Mucilaginibacter gossypii]|uniref:hypothetical protein n=1 Tax=Mucilaginibacter gossypii TaxID=551996 RepID=UPI000DCBB293|nr:MULTISPECIES: hypothetical protein [Mucilaginibacter]QTE39036.1 hypothetical protein J3L18_08260 [Mucilaginibacter gossypii]RAV53422.1 hypothetical protein DIU36_23380 [Mucilaginibacter rubeus]
MKELINEEIEVETYLKYYEKFQAEKTRLSEEISYNQKLGDDSLHQQTILLTSLTSIPGVYKKANLNQKHPLLKGRSNIVSCLERGHIAHPTSIRRSRITY